MSFCQGLQKLFDGICSCCSLQKFLLVFCCPLISFFVSNITFFCRVERLLWYIIPIIIHTIKDAVGIPKYGTCQISGGCRLNRKVPHYVFAVEIIHHWIHEKKNLLYFFVYLYAYLLVETKMEWHYFHNYSFGMWTVVYCCLHFFNIACEINPDLLLFFCLMLFM